MVVADTRVAAIHAGGRLRVCLALVVVAWGVQAIVTQSLLLREALVLMYGSEFAWGIVLFAWLSGVAMGAWTGGRWAERVRGAELGLVVVLLGLGLICVPINQIGFLLGVVVSFIWTTRPITGSFSSASPFSAASAHSTWLEQGPWQASHETSISAHVVA